MKQITFFLISFISSISLLAQVPIANFSTSNVCMGDQSSFFDLSSNTPTSWYWDFGDASGTSTAQNPNYFYASPGSYNVMFVATNANGSDTIYNIATVFALPNVNAGPDDDICVGTSAQLNASGAATYYWTPTNDLNDPNLAAPIATPSSTTTYTLTGTDANGCVAVDFVDITVNPLPAASYTSYIQCGDNGGDSAVVDLTSLDYLVNESTGNPVAWYEDGAYTINIPDYVNYFVDTTFKVVYTEVTDIATGCINTNIVEINIAINNIAVGESTNDVLCNGGCDGTAMLTPSGGTPPYTYNWTPGGMTTASINSLCAGTYTYTILDANACMYIDDVTIMEPSALSLFLTPTDASCFGAADGFISSTPIGGTPGYSYNWNDPSFQTTATATGLTAGNYTLTVTDGNGCTVMEAADIYEPSPNGSIAGTVNFQGSPIDMGSIELIRKDGSTPADLTLIDTYSIFTGGVFEFHNLESGIYILKAYGDTTLYSCAPTYADGTIQWDLANEWDITSSCSNDSIVLEISLIEIPVNSGTGTINGRLIENDGSITNKAPGDPIPDIDITVEQSPGGAIMGATTTDFNGDFSFDNLPDGSYIVYADMHGYTMNISGTVDLSGGSNNVNIVICSDDTTYQIGMCDNPTSVSQNIFEEEISIYPNPAKDVLNVFTTNNEVYNLSITDVTGKAVYNKKLINSSNQIDVSSFVTGIYFVRIYNDKSNIYQKLIIE
ncbi:MAG: T9SS type A sorting domain-containing protein [Flavobacteriales bacterium]|nr:T9SS type A sorting domain-containing protein [Flavobacteriales bacterium]MCB9335867.1 T9SS type A sorting domain-containing protein [Flavobacteriales bacterium]